MAKGRNVGSKVEISEEKCALAEGTPPQGETITTACMTKLCMTGFVRHPNLGSAKRCIVQDGQSPFILHAPSIQPPQRSGTRPLEGKERGGRTSVRPTGRPDCKRKGIQVRVLDALRTGGYEKSGKGSRGPGHGHHSLSLHPATGCTLRTVRIPVPSSSFLER